MSNKLSLYKKAFINVVESNKDNLEDLELMKKLIFYGVKVVCHKEAPIDYQGAYSEFEFHSVLKQMIETITPTDFMEIFPIKKDYSGHKYGMKDYYHTTEYLKTIDLDKPIQNALEFMMRYWNDDINELNLKMIMNLSHLRRMQGAPSLAEEWAYMNDIPTYTMHTDNAGNEYLLDQYGKTQKVERAKPKPRHLKLVK